LIEEELAMAARREQVSLPPLSGLFQNEIRPRRKPVFKQGVEGTSF
jgi:hypothetical protein